MIGYLQGMVVDKVSPANLLVNVQGVGYELSVPLSVFVDTPLHVPNTTFYTHLQIREDAHQLYGFADKQARDFFRQLIRINGIGPKLALSMLSAMPLNRLVRILAEQEVAQLVALPGIGKKMAERLIVETAAWIPAWVGLVGATMTTPVSPVGADAIAALVHLGYKLKEATPVVEKLQQQGDWDRETLLRQALKVLAPL